MRGNLLGGGGGRTLVSMKYQQSKDTLNNAHSPRNWNKVPLHSVGKTPAACVPECVIRRGALPPVNLRHVPCSSVSKEAPPRFELGISCLLDRRFNQLSHGATSGSQIHPIGVGVVDDMSVNISVDSVRH